MACESKRLCERHARTTWRGTRAALRIVSYRWNTAARTNATLRDHVRHGKVGFNVDDLYGAKLKAADGTSLVPQPVLALWFRPTLRESQNETFAPAAIVVADMANDLWTATGRVRGITLQVTNVAHRAPDFSVRPT